MANPLRSSIALLIFTGLLLPVISVSAAGFVPCTGTGANACDVCDIFEMITNIYNFIVFRLMPVLAGLLFLWGGVMMVLAGASEESYKKGRAIFINTAIGVVIVLVSWLAVNTVLVEFAKSTSTFSTGSWWQGVRCQ
ncbi:MAG: hypothetical protein UU87_C0001G0056 [Parcubacteria group bacterium GW2011_GWA2_42_11]|nr:MAG: hypothetical protein UU87_C0001G0056 [Parcubacteria group bacterium GW2011_GWA2_42_11]